MVNHLLMSFRNSIHSPFKADHNCFPAFQDSYDLSGFHHRYNLGRQGGSICLQKLYGQQNTLTDASGLTYPSWGRKMHIFSDYSCLEMLENCYAPP